MDLFQESNFYDDIPTAVVCNTRKDQIDFLRNIAERGWVWNGGAPINDKQHYSLDTKFYLFSKGTNGMQRGWSPINTDKYRVLLYEAGCCGNTTLFDINITDMV